MKYHSFFPTFIRIATQLTSVLAVLILLKVGYYTFSDTARHAYWACIQEKQHLLDSVASPRIILTGGSAVAFGIDSDILSNEFGVPVVNIGIHHELGIRLMLNQLKQATKRGDLILFCLEPNTTLAGNFDTQLKVAEYYQPARDWLVADNAAVYALHHLQHYLRASYALYTGFFGPAKNVSINDTTAVYYRTCFNSYGDMVGHLNNGVALVESFDSAGVQHWTPQLAALNDFGLWAQKQGATVLLLYPPWNQRNFEENSSLVHRFEQQITRQLHWKTLGSPTLAVMDDQFFYDNYCHPNGQGRRIWTYRLIDLLEISGQL